MKKDFDFIIDPSILSNPEQLKICLAKEVFEKPENISDFQILKRSIDARSRKVGFQIRGFVYMDEKAPPPEIIQPFSNVKGKPEVVIIGAGPAGLFAAIRLIQLGIKPIIMERGKPVRERRRDLAELNRKGIVNPESNYCFGEGGAGTYSDGKLYTRSGKRGNIDTILNLLVHFGADPDIKVNARPHIGTNRLPDIITRIRESILEFGGEVHFEHKLTGFHHAFGAINGVEINKDIKIPAQKIILATGHSASDIFYLLHRSGIRVEAKPFALGVRMEHSQSLIDQIQYHSSERNPFLPPAYYQLKEQIDHRGVFSFCMCPGGIIAPCATQEGQVVVNGWSPSKRNNPFSNSGMVVQVELEDLKGFGKMDNPFLALEFQESVEKKAYEYGGGQVKAPAQRMVDFVQGKLSNHLPSCSYIPGLNSSPMREVLPDFIFQKLKAALPVFGKKMPGYYTNEALVVGVESRTSSPIKIPRDPETLEHPDCRGLYPCGEGGGYAGGILSAAMEGFKVAECIVKNF